MQKNIYNMILYEENSHGGIGKLLKNRIFDKGDFKSHLQYIDYVIVNAGQTIGLHSHKEDEEIYFILSGEGIMNVNGEQIKIEKGDIITNPYFGTHELINNSKDKMEMFIFDVAK